MLSYDESGALVPRAPLTTQEKDAVLAYAKVADPSKVGLALSQLRSPASRVSLQRMQVIADSLIADSKLRSVVTQTQRGGAFLTYFWT